MIKDIRFGEQDISWKWEAFLRPQIPNVELLGEIPITAEECEQLGQAIGYVVELYGHGRSLRLLKKHRPATFAVYLVAQGIHGYEGGDYWSQVVETTGFSRERTFTVGRAFEEVLEDFKLPLFYDMRAEKAHRYVSLILAHGGIPTYCLDDFFVNVVQPSVVRAVYVDMAAAELIDEWQYHAQAQYQTAKPILRFLIYGGRVAEDFLDRCREMAQIYLDEGVVPNPAEVRLPQRVVSAYDEWVEKQNVEHVTRETGDRWQLRKPQMLVDPWGEGVLIDLPPQQVPATEVYTDLTWRIITNGSTDPIFIPVPVRRVGFDRKTESEVLPLPSPAAKIEVSLVVDNTVKRTWRYRGIEETTPLLAFDPDRGVLIPWTRSLPAEHLGLLYPGDLDLHVEGEGRLIEVLPRMPWGWSAFRGETWDLTRATRLVFTKEENEVLAIHLRPAEIMPAMVGGECLSPANSGDRASVYVGAPPSIRIPLTGRQQLNKELARWQITLHNTWLAEPELNATIPLTELKQDLVVAEDYVDLPLSLPRLLGQNPCGNYAVRLRGPLGSDAGFTLRMIPHFVLCGQEQLYLPTARDGPQRVTLLAESLPGEHIECLVEDGTCQVHISERGATAWEHEIEIGPSVTDAALTLVHPHPSGEKVRVPLRVPIHRLRWALVDEETAARRSVWTGSMIKEPVEALYQRQAPSLLIKIPLQETDGVQLELRLLNIDGKVLQVADRVTLPDRRLTVRFDLSAFLDTMRASRSPILRFELAVGELPHRETPLRLPLLSLTRTLLVENVDLTLRVDDDRTEFHLTWDEPVHLRNRLVRFWSLWRPWDPALDKRIPDEVKEEFSFSMAPNDLRMGKYRLEFLVIDPWTVQVEEPHRPSSDDPNTADIEIVSADIYLEMLDRRIQEGGPDFETLLERAAVSQDIGMVKKAEADRKWCYHHLDAGTIPQRLALIDLADDADDTILTRLIQLKLSAARRVKQLLVKRKADDLALDTFESYLRNLPITRRVPLKTCKYLVSVENESTRLHAVQQLIQREDPLGPNMVVHWVEEAALSDTDAVSLLGLNVVFSAEILKQNPDNPVVMRLLKALAPALGDRILVIHPGTWVYTNVGWGRIDRIENQNGELMSQFLVGQIAYRLRVTLRPAVDAEPVLIDLHNKSIIFTDADILYTCAKCKGFSAQDPYLISERHDYVAHGGVGPCYRKEKTTERYLSHTKYQVNPPPNRGTGVPETFLPGAELSY